MPGPFTQILFKAEDAIALRLQSIAGSLLGAGIHKGGGNEELEGTYLNVLADQAEDRQPRGSGNFTVRAKIEINTSADDEGREKRIALAGVVGDLFWDDGIAAALSADLADFTVLGLLVENQTQRVDGRRHVYGFELLMVCASSDV